MMKTFVKGLTLFLLLAIMIAPDKTVSATEPPIDPVEIGQAPRLKGPVVLQDENKYGVYHDALALEAITVTALILDFETPNMPRLDVWRRDTKEFIASVPAPSSGPWGRPFALQRLESQVNFSVNGSFWNWTVEFTNTGRFIAVDGFAPGDTGASARVIEYEFEFDILRNTLNITEVGIAHLPADDKSTPYDLDGNGLEGLWYPTTFKVTPDRRLIVGDTFQGSIWVSSVNDWEDVHIAYASPTLHNSTLLGNPSFRTSGDTVIVDGQEVSGFTYKRYNHETSQFEDVPMEYDNYGLPAAWMPGLHGLSYVPGVVGDPTKPDMVVFCSSGPDITGNANPISALPMSVLLNTTIPFHAKDSYLRTIVPSTNGHTEWIAEVPYPGAGRWIYYVHVYSSQDDDTDFTNVIGNGYRSHTMYRAHLDTGEVQKVFDDYYYLAFSSNQNVGRLPYWMPEQLNDQVMVITTTNTNQDLTWLMNRLLTDFGFGEGYEGPVIGSDLRNFFNYMPWRRATETWVWVN